MTSVLYFWFIILDNNSTRSLHVKNGLQCFFAIKRCKIWQQLNHEAQSQFSQASEMSIDSDFWDQYFF